MSKLFPPIDPYKTEYLQVSKTHQLYLEQSGNPHGKPVIHLHGGPGSYSKPDQRRFYDPEKYHIIIFDQRGCGKSKPAGEIKENTTWEIVEDIERIRNHLKIKNWLIHGRSWGSTLALAYSEKYPNRIKALILGGIFTFRKFEVDWFSGGAKLFYPDAWERLTKNLDIKNKDNLNEFMTSLLSSSNTKKAIRAARDYDIWNDHLMRLVPKISKKKLPAEASLNAIKILFHYINNGGFLKEGQLLQNAYKIRHIPTVIIQGRYDMCCPPITAWELFKRLPQAELYLLPKAGHKSQENGVVEKIIEYTNKFSYL